jgi:hypothetical protein
MNSEPIFIDTGSSVTLSTTLNETLTSIDTTITLTNATDFPRKGVIRIDNEYILFTGKSSNNLTGCVRGYSNTIATTHSSGTSVSTVARSSQASITTDKKKAGWYFDRFHNDKTLRVSDSDLLLPGTIRFNYSNNAFQGFNGESWVEFNGIQGEKGEDGEDGIASFDVDNLPKNQTLDGEVYSGKVDNELRFRSLNTTTFDINQAITNVDSISITKSDDYLTLVANPRPYQWDMSSNNTVTYFKSSLSASTLKAFGTIQSWKVKIGQTVTIGTAVRITLSVSGTGYKEATTELVIEPYTYSASQEEIKAGSAPLGIAMETKTGGNSCLVCTDGITTVVMGDGNGAGNQTSTSIDGPGAHGFVGYDGKVYNESISTGISSNTPTMGYWLERGSFNLGSAVLFYVKTSFSMT